MTVNDCGDFKFDLLAKLLVLGWVTGENQLQPGTTRGYEP